MSAKGQESDLERAEREHRESQARLAAAKARSPVTHSELDQILERLHGQLDPILELWPRVERGSRRSAFILDAVTKSDPKALEVAKAAADEFDQKESQERSRR